jgi:dipeptidyl aminopeptidase/acylaminoacyl peptidase
MNKLRHMILTLVIAAAWPALALAEKIPMMAWVHDPVISSVDVSPNGEKLVALTLSDVNEPADITVWDTGDLSKPPERFRPDDIKVLAVGWLNNEQLYAFGRRKFDYQVGSKTRKWFQDKAYIVHSKDKRFREILRKVDSVGTSLFSSLPTKPDKVLISVTNLEFAEDIYEVDLESYNSKRIQRGATGESYLSDIYGNVRARVEIVGSGDDIRVEYSYVHPEDESWDAHHALYAAKREGLEPVGFDVDGRTVYMLDNTGRDKKVVRKYDLVSRELGDPVFADAGVEATGVMQSRRPEELGKLIGFTGMSDDIVAVYSDDLWASVQNRIEASLPGGARHSISAYSDDFTVIVVSSTGPRQPTKYNLLINGTQLIDLGTSYPFLSAEKLADVQYVTYEARDGLEIPAYLTLPTSGSAPYPAVVMPHGGPWARDVPRFDYWVQFLANRGYAVLQPQFRGSDGWGQKLWRAGDKEWGQKMQDDNDDGALWLVEQGIAARDRLAIYGYSYGGYAAMAAVVRPDTPFQCAIAGASSDIRNFDRKTFEGGRFNRRFQNVSVGGLNVIDHIEDASIPVFIFHGERDQNVPIWTSEGYYRALQRAEKQVEYLEIVDMWHSLPWWPQHHLAVLETLEGFLGERCGPGGL